jgi:hypothetical protein
MDRIRHAMILIGLACAGVASSHGAFAADAMLLPPSRSVSGLSQGEWSVRGWQWAASFQYEESPVADRSGEKCAARQSGDVWFLAGTYGTKRTIRTCTVPEGKYLFFPLINYVVFPRAEDTSGCAPRVELAAQMTDEPSTLVLDLDGVRFEGLQRHRQPSPGCFDVGSRSVPPRKIFPAAANGYYVMIGPLERGTHMLNFGGALPSMLQAVTYRLHVE